jgi:O-glycosyl hydrolase
MTSSTPLLAQEVTIDGNEAQTHQTVEGFGTCLVAWVPQFRELYMTVAFQKTYAEDLGMTMLRAYLRGRVMPEPVENWQDIKWQDFKFDERAAIFPQYGKALREKHHPDFKIVGSVWSPPDWMKVNKHKNDTRSGGVRVNDYRGIDNRLDERYYNHFAKWMLEMVKYYEHHGAPLVALSIANEPQFTQTFESCVWNGPDYARAVALVGRMLEEEGYGHIRLFGPETMTSHFYEGGTGDYLRSAMEDPEARKYLKIWILRIRSASVTSPIRRNCPLAPPEPHSVARRSGGSGCGACWRCAVRHPTRLPSLEDPIEDCLRLPGGEGPVLTWCQLADSDRSTVAVGLGPIKTGACR